MQGERFHSKAQSEFEQCKERFDDIKAECKKLDDEYKLIKDQYAGRIKKDIEQIKEQMSDLKADGDKLIQYLFADGHSFFPFSLI
ncbi:MAG: hypothetical protein A2020_08570 [Lentisphaerae bacterium GWF2_45_14]|nr:MAG: hypothetical protein A2020_08570 [Lentisphaerae bacterium GWF2_45_14]